MTNLNYNQFSGTIQVMKAVADHLVLTFCQKTEGSELFSIVLSRRPNSLSKDVSYRLEYYLFLFSVCLDLYFFSLGKLQCAKDIRKPWT